jgi:hypothetical protein
VGSERADMWSRIATIYPFIRMQCYSAGAALVKALTYLANQTVGVSLGQCARIGPHAWRELLAWYGR